MVRKYQPAPVVDPVLAKILGKQPNPTENLMGDQGLSFFLNSLASTDTNLTPNGRIVRLECGHFVLSKASRKTKCPRCGEMIRSGYDYEGFRTGRDSDEFHWPDDPAFSLNEAKMSVNSA